MSKNKMQSTNMRDLFEIINESELVCEAFKEKHIYQAWKTLRDKGMKWSDIFSDGNAFRWSEIDKNDVEIVDVDDIEDEFVKIRRLKSGKDTKKYVVFGFKNEELICIFHPWDTSITIVYAKSTDRFMMDTNSDRDYKSQKEQFAILASCDYLVKVYIDAHFTNDMRNARREAKNGVWELTDYDHKSHHLTKGVLGKDPGGRSDYIGWDSYYGRCKALAEAAVKRWKTIVADRKFAQSQDTKEVDDAVQNIMSRLTKVASNITKDPQKYDVSSSYSFRSIMEMIYDQRRHNGGRSYTSSDYIGKDGLLMWYNRYCGTIIDLKSKGGYRDSSSLLKDRDQYKEIILTLCKKLDGIFKKYDA